MLHEVLLALSGHPSPLFDQDSAIVHANFPSISPPELQLLQRIGRISKLHLDLKSQIRLVQTKHPSPICNAISTAISTSQLSAFQQQLLDFEKRILAKDSSIVGAYNIVPLATISGEFEQWTRLFEWLLRLATFMLPGGEGGPSCSGADAVNKLRKDAQTGYEDIQKAALQLSSVAELAWLRQLSNWLLHGQLPRHGGVDFFIKSNQSESSTEFIIEKSNMPKFVTEDCANGILFIGKSLNQIRSRNLELGPQGGKQHKSETDLIPTHRRILSDLPLPIAASNLSEAVFEIRKSLSQEILQKLLPLEDVIGILRLFREILLLGHGEFAVALIREADERFESRSRQNALQSRDLLKGPLMKSAEVTAILRKTWTYLFSLLGENDELMDTLELGRDLVHLTTHPIKLMHSKAPRPTKHVSFDDFLLPVQSSLTVDISSPLDLFLSQQNIADYSALNAYLLSIRRSHHHLADLWKQSALRRDHPTPAGPPRSCTPFGTQDLIRKRVRFHKRRHHMRKVWATSSASLYLLHELGEYFEGQVVPTLWEHLMTWVIHSTPSSRPSTADTNLLGQSKSRPNSSRSTELPSFNSNFQRLSIRDTEPPSTPHDPASLSAAHQAFLTHLCNALLLTDSDFTRALHDLLQSIDDLISQILRLQTIERNLDLEEDEGVEDALSNNEQDHKQCLVELHRARTRVDSATKSVVSRLKLLGDVEREAAGGELIPSTENSGLKSEYVPRALVVKLEWLLMKLEFGKQDHSVTLHDDD
jgi:hypothetical protein